MKAVLVGVALPDVSEADHLASLAEMTRLAHTLGFEIVETITQKRPTLSAVAVLGEGKLKELARLTGGTGEIPSGATRKITKAMERAQEEAEAEAEESGEVEAPEAEGPAPDPIASVVIIDNDIGPSQIRNLEKATGAEVLDRSGVIIEIFHRHARTREARLQVELARLAYEAPRLREKPNRADRQRGGAQGGPGESDLELDRRRIRDRMAVLRRELESISTEQGTRRARRREENKVALVGYTNAGKSSLMRALTGSEVLVADQLFATLGTTVRVLTGDVTPRILVSDTVGFIKNLPHDLVASFRSTLDEAGDASLLLFVVDASDPAFESQLKVTRDVLADIGIDDIPQKLVLNKTDRLSDEARAALLEKFPDAIQTSAVTPRAVAELRDTIRSVFERDWVQVTLAVPYKAMNVVGEIRAKTRVLGEDHDEHGVNFSLRGPASIIDGLRTRIGSMTTG